jgi:BTB/POZ domain
MRSLGDYLLVVKQVEAVYAEHTAAAHEGRPETIAFTLRVFSDKLSRASPFFAALFSSEMKETQEKTVVLEVEEPDVLIGIIEFCYSQRTPAFSK